MPVSQQVVTRLEQIDRSILSLLAERIRVRQEAQDDAEEGETVEEDLGALLSRWEEAWEEEGNDAAGIASVGKAVFVLCRNA